MVKETFFWKFAKVLTLERLNLVIACSVVKSGRWDEIAYVIFNPVGAGTSQYSVIWNGYFYNKYKGGSEAT